MLEMCQFYFIRAQQYVIVLHQTRWGKVIINS